MTSPRPNFIGIGAQKCATSWLHEALHSHPQIFTSDPKEIDFFSSYYDRGYEWYERHFAAAGAAQARGETSPSYFYNPAAPARARAYDPSMRIIVILRDPVDRAYSNHLHEIRAGHYSASTAFEDGLANNPCYVDQSRYATHLAAWYAQFPSEQILPLIFEEITQTPDQALRQVYSFLGVDPAGRIDSSLKSANESVAFRHPQLQSLLQKAGHGLRRSGMGPMLEAFKALPPVRRAMELNKRDLRRITPPMLPETRSRLAGELQDEMRRLADMLGRSSLPWRSMSALFDAPARPLAPAPAAITAQETPVAGGLVERPRSLHEATAGVGWALPPLVNP